MSLVGPEGWSALRDLTDDERADLASPGRCECCRRHIEGEPVTDSRDPRVRYCSEQCRIDHVEDEPTADLPVETMRAVVDGRLR